MAAPSSVIDVTLSSLTTAVFHPIGYTKILIQIGHEPIASKHGRYMWGTEAYFYPNIRQYASYIWNLDGFLGMYSGLIPRLVGSNVGRHVQNAVLEYLRKDEQENKEEEEEEELQNWIKTFCIKTSQESVARFCGLLASQPFHVIMVRQMAQFVGGETCYNGFFPAIREVYNQDGIKGFFAGLVPRLIGELVQIWASNLVSSLLSRYIIDSKWEEQFPKPSEVQTYVHYLCGFIISSYTYPFTVVSNVMAVSGTELVAAQPPNMRPYANWRECWAHLKRDGQLKRGSSMFWRVDFLRTKTLKGRR